MGGLGSGRDWVARKRLTSQYLELDVRRWSGQGLLTAGKQFTVRWLRGKKEIGSVGVSVEQDRVILSYSHTQNGVSQDERRPVKIEWIACNYGGRRPWLFRPAEGCGRHVAILYGDGGDFACRRCHNLVYKSQRRAPYQRALENAQKIRIELGGTGNMYQPFPGKPKRMHWSTYDRLREKERKANAASYPLWLMRWAQNRR